MKSALPSSIHLIRNSVAAFALVAPGLALAVDYTWIGTNTGNWTDGTRWSTAPVDDNTYPSSASDNIVGNTGAAVASVNGSYTIGDISLTTTGWTIQGNNGTSPSSLTFDEFTNNAGSFAFRRVDSATAGTFTLSGRQVNIGTSGANYATSFGNSSSAQTALSSLSISEGITISNASSLHTLSFAVASDYNLGLITHSGAGTKVINLTQSFNGMTRTATVSGLSGVSGGLLTIRTASVTTVDPSAATLKISGTGSYVSNALLVNGSGHAGNTLALVKEGTGTQTLTTGSHTYSGGTAINEGTLLVNNTTGTSGLGLGGTVTVAAAGTLGGTGAISNVTIVSGAIAPGDAGIESFDIANDTTWNGGVAWKFELGSVNASDRLNITGGSSDFLKGTGSSWSFDFQNTGLLGGVYTLVDWGGTTTFSASDFSYTNLASGLQGAFSFNGSQLDFTVTAVPEPSTWALLGAGLMTVAFFGRRRNPGQR